MDPFAKIRIDDCGKTKGCFRWVPEVHVNFVNAIGLNNVRLRLPFSSPSEITALSFYNSVPFALLPFTNKCENKRTKISYTVKRKDTGMILLVYVFTITKVPKYVL